METFAASDERVAKAFNAGTAMGLVTTEVGRKRTLAHPSPGRSASVCLIWERLWELYVLTGHYPDKPIRTGGDGGNRKLHTIYLIRNHFFARPRARP